MHGCCQHMVIWSTFLRALREKKTDVPVPETLSKIFRQEFLSREVPRSHNGYYTEAVCYTLSGSAVRSSGSYKELSLELMPHNFMLGTHGRGQRIIAPKKLILCTLAEIKLYYKNPCQCHNFSDHLSDLSTVDSAFTQLYHSSNERSKHQIWPGIRCNTTIKFYLFQLQHASLTPHEVLICN